MAVAQNSIVLLLIPLVAIAIYSIAMVLVYGTNADIEGWLNKMSQAVFASYGDQSTLQANTSKINVELVDYEINSYNVCIFIFATSKDNDHLHEIQQASQTWASSQDNNNIWFVWDHPDFQKYDKNKLDTICNSAKHKQYTTTHDNYDNCIFLPENEIHPALPDFKKIFPLKKKLFDLLKYIQNPSNTYHSHLQHSCESFMKIDSDAYVTVERLNTISGCMDGFNKLWFMGPLWNRNGHCGLRTNYPLGFAMSISNALYQFIFDDNIEHNIIPSITKDFKKYGLTFDPNLEIRNNESIFEHCYRRSFEPIKDKNGELTPNPCWDGSDDVGMSYCLNSLFKFDRINRATMMQPLYAGYSRHWQFGFWSLASIQSARFESNMLKTNYVWHQIDANELLDIHKWYLNESQTPQSKYYQHLNYHIESTAKIVNETDVVNFRARDLNQRHWEMILHGKCGPLKNEMSNDGVKSTDARRLMRKLIASDK